MIKSQARIEAINNGYKFYTPETPCLRGHTLRTVSDGRCVECRRIMERLLVKKNRASYNARKRKERQHRLPEIALKAKQTRASEPMEIKTLRREKAKIKAVEWRLKNPNHEGVKISKAKWRLENRGSTNALCIKRRLAKINRTPKWVTQDDLETIKQIYTFANNLSKVFGTKYHVDHIVPLQGMLVSGLHVPSNLQIIPAVDNVKKSNSYEVGA